MLLTRTTALLLTVLAFAPPRGSAWLLGRSQRGPLLTRWSRPAAAARRRASGALAPPLYDAPAGAGGEGEEDPRLRAAVDAVAEQVRARLAEKQQQSEEGSGDDAAASVASSSSSGGGGGGVEVVAGASPDATAVASTKSSPAPNTERFQMVYTCGPCDTRNLISVNRVSWESGVVIATCRGCGKQHLLADNAGLLDQGNATAFSNIVDLLEQRGEGVTRLGSANAERLNEWYLTSKSGGGDGDGATDGRATVELVPRPGEVFQKFNDNGELVATSTSAQPAAARVGAYGLGNSAETPDDDGAPLSVTQATVRVRAGLADAGDGGAPPDAAAAAGEAGIEEVLVDARYDVYGAEEGVGLVVPLPLDVLEQVEEGDVLQVTTKFGLLQVPVPATIEAVRAGAAAMGGCALRVRGALELTLPRGVIEGEALEVVLPDGSGATQVVAVPAGATERSLLAVAFPVDAEQLAGPLDLDDGLRGGGGDVAGPSAS